MATTKKPAAETPAAKAAPAKTPATATATKKTGGLDGFFKISERGSTIGTEVRGGLTTFFTMAYIVVLNPLIIGTVAASDGTFLGGGQAPNLAMVAAVTALVAGVMTIAMGFIANFPLALAAGLGLNAFVAYGLVVNKGYSWPEAMGMIVIEGTVVLLLVLTKFRIRILYAVPVALKKAIAAGIGLFLAFIGLWDAGLVHAPFGGATPAEFGNGGYIDTWPMVVFLVGLVTAIVLMARKTKGALLISIAVATVVAFVIEWREKIGPLKGPDGSIVNPHGWQLVVPTFADKAADWTPDLGLLGKVSVFGGFIDHGVAWKVILTGVLVVFSLLVVDFFDTMGTMTAVGEEGGLNDKDDIPAGSQKILIVDSVAAIAGGAASASSNTSYIESAAGVGDGARTGLASVVTGLAFIAAMFLTPLYQVVPFEAATPVLVVVGFLMVTMVVDIDWKDLRIAIPAFLTMIVMPFGYSISAGIGLGFISYVILMAATGKAKEVKALMWVVASLFVLYFALGPIDHLVNG
jgi:AGZA family xanthine/uracil permease-like MFS transporter